MVSNRFTLLRFLGHLYAAEALISLDRISDAITHLNPENVTDVSLGVSPSEQDQGKLTPLNTKCDSCIIVGVSTNT